MTGGGTDTVAPGCLHASGLGPHLAQTEWSYRHQYTQETGRINRSRSSPYSETRYPAHWSLKKRKTWLQEARVCFYFGLILCEA